jgi:hypothetical protein
MSNKFKPFFWTAETMLPGGQAGNISSIGWGFSTIALDDPDTEKFIIVAPEEDDSHTGRRTSFYSMVPDGDGMPSFKQVGIYDNTSSLFNFSLGEHNRHSNGEPAMLSGLQNWQEHRELFPDYQYPISMTHTSRDMNNQGELKFDADGYLTSLEYRPTGFNISKTFNFSSTKTSAQTVSLTPSTRMDTRYSKDGTHRCVIRGYFVSSIWSSDNAYALASIELYRGDQRLYSYFFGNLGVTWGGTINMMVSHVSNDGFVFAASSTFSMCVSPAGNPMYAFKSSALNSPEMEFLAEIEDSLFLVKDNAEVVFRITDWKSDSPTFTYLDYDTIHISKNNTSYRGINNHWLSPLMDPDGIHAWVHSANNWTKVDLYANKYVGHWSLNDDMNGSYAGYMPTNGVIAGDHLFVVGYTKISYSSSDIATPFCMCLPLTPEAGVDTASTLFDDDIYYGRYFNSTAGVAERSMNTTIVWDPNDTSETVSTATHTNLTVSTSSYGTTRLSWFENADTDPANYFINNDLDPSALEFDVESETPYLLRPNNRIEV